MLRAPYDSRQCSAWKGVQTCGALVQRRLQRIERPPGKRPQAGDGSGVAALPEAGGAEAGLAPRVARSFDGAVQQGAAKAAPVEASPPRMKGGVPMEQRPDGSKA